VKFSENAALSGEPQWWRRSVVSVVFDGYVRVSQVRGRSGERFISPALQRQQIEGWIRLRGGLIGDVFDELDESGARRDRPLLEQALQRIENGASQGLVVAKLDRSAARWSTG
jgi:DNA invertase Pin-like site-specific DNA recombinase